jgi:DNA modification methylase
MIPARVALALQADGWYLRSDIVWAKPNPMPESVTDRPTKAHEYLFLLAKSARYFYDAEAIKEEASDTSGWAKQRATGVDTWQYSVRAANADLGIRNGISSGFGERGARNRRTVWTVATQPCPLAHFATMPPALVEPCIKAGTSERGCCPVCGAPWERVVEKERQPRGDAFGRKDIGEYDHGQAGAPYMETVAAHTLGWQPTCGCPEHEPVPCVVLDPFGGAGTTMLVADRLGRHGVGVELSGEYTRMARRRCYEDAPLLAYATEGAS